jgi:lysophospholipase L1-like esterase
MIVRPDLWGTRFRVRLANTFGTRPITFDDVFLGVQAMGGNIVPGTNRPVTFDRGKRAITIAPGAATFSDPIDMTSLTRAQRTMLTGRKLAVSFHVPGPSGPITWHSKALTTSYVTAPRGGSHGKEDQDTAFPFSSTSWYFLDAIDVMAADDTVGVVAFGDSITDGSNTTINGDDRWSDVLSRRLHTMYGDRVSVVNVGIGGNQITFPPRYPTDMPTPTGPSAIQRLDRDVLERSGVTAVLWMEGINDLARGATAQEVIDGMKMVVARLRAKGLKIYGGTLTSALGAMTAHGTPEVDQRRQAINAFVRTPGSFDDIVDFDAAVRDPATGALKPPFASNTSIGGPGDKIHPNRAGYKAMGEAIDLKWFAPSSSAGQPGSR